MFLLRSLALVGLLFLPAIAATQSPAATPEPAPPTAAAPPSSPANDDSAVPEFPAATPVDNSAAIEPPDAAANSPAPAADANDATLAAYVEGLAHGMLTRGDIAGMVVSVVRRDRTVLVGGYGRASLEPERAADGTETLFRIGSVSKTFTYTAAMQLIERGRIGLDDPVNLHLPEALKLPDAGYAEPVRVRHLMSHTAGFEDSALGHLFGRDPARVLPLADYLARHRPARVRPPGTVAVYSNYSLGLLGALVAQVSGLSFEDYVEQNLTGPLGMSRSSFREPGLPDTDARRLDPALAAALATGYERKAGGFEPGVFQYMAQVGPAGAMSATAADMARWMRVHLREGELDGTRILTSENARRMREILFRNAGDPGVGAVAHGFLAGRVGPHFSYGHGGATLYFHSTLLLLPEADLGVFVSANTGNARSAVLEVARLIVERLAPETAVLPATVTTDASALARFAGSYRSNRRNYSRIEKLIMDAGSDITVAPGSDGALRVSAGGETMRWVPVAATVFVDPETGSRAEFLTDAAGEVTGLVSGFGIAVAEKLEPWERSQLLWLAIVLAALIALLRLLQSMRREKRPAPARPGLWAVKSLSIVSALAWLGFAALLVLAAIGMSAERSQVMFSYPSRELVWALWAAMAVAAIAVLEVLALVPVWRSDWYAWPKWRYTFATLIIAATVALMWTWNLIGMKL
jgi:CubicO group peptidase (beta-lactamase class C family)